MLADLFSRTTLGMKLGLHTISALLEALGHPERSYPNVLIAGTNGKGSTTALLTEMLRAAGHRVGRFTSPHLLRFSERFVIDGQEASDEAIANCYEQIRAVEGALDQQPTFFECATAIAALLFAKAQVDVAVFEVGLGGRLDATNAIPRKLSVITPIGMDHQHLLGDSIEAIAGEKAGILTHQGHSVFARQAPAARKVLMDRARELECDVVEAPEPDRLEDGVTVDGPWGEPLRIPNTLPGAFQADNVSTAATAAWALNGLGILCPAEAVVRGAADLRWPGRYQHLDISTPTLLDGAHNPEAIAALLDAVERDPRYQGRPCHCIFTALRTKDGTSMLGILGSRLSSLHLTPVGSKRSLSTGDLAQLSPQGNVHPTFSEAWSAASSRADSDDGFVLVTGSLFLVADALAGLTGERRDPPVDG